MWKTRLQLSLGQMNCVVWFCSDETRVGMVTLKAALLSSFPQGDFELVAK